MERTTAGRDAFAAGRDMTVYTAAPSSVPLTAAVRDTGLVFSAANVAAFTGREWLLADVDRFFSGSQCGYVLVEAEAGLGKTAFAAWLVKEREYVSHFSRYSGGRSVKAALQNLSAQLILRFGLDDLAPGGVLPEWAQSPGGFEHVLSRAAAKAAASGEPLVLVVDGLDEAESDAGGLPFGLPLLLPGLVFVVATCRTGTPLVTPGVPLLVARISKEDPRNARDIRSFLAAATEDDRLAARLAEGGISPVDFVNLLGRRSEGVWVYLRYVLEELRLGLRRADTIDGLPAGLRGYYADQMRRWQHHPGWDDSLLPLLATLGVAGEPLTAATLAALTGGLDLRTIRHLCDFTFRPLLTATRDHSQAPRQYEIYHTSFRQLLKAEHASQHDADSSAGIPYDLEALTDQLGQATLQAHSRIATTYLDRFGGLSNGLPVLAGDPHVAGIDDGYPLRHLARHLHHAGLADDLHQLLAASQAVGEDRSVNVWFSAHDAAGTLASYLDDLTRAQDIAAAATDQAVARHVPAPSLGLEIHYAMVAASIRSRATLITPELLGLLLCTGLWSPERALDHSRRLTDVASRLDAFTAIIQHASTRPHDLTTAEVLDAAIGMSDEKCAARALIGLAPHLPPDQLIRALSTATALGDNDRDEVLTALAPYLPPGQLTRALDAANTIGEDLCRARALTGLGPYLPPDELTRALDAANAIREDGARAEALIGLAAYLPSGKQLTARTLAFNTATAISAKDSRVWALIALAPNVTPDQLAQAFEVAITVPEERARAAALAGLAPYLTPDQVARASNVASAIRDGNDRAQALAGLAPYLPPEQQSAALTAALDAATKISDEGQRAWVLAELAPHLPPSQLLTAVSCALDSIVHMTDIEQAEVLPALAPHLPVDELHRAFDIGVTMRYQDSRAEAMAALVPHMPADQLRAAVNRALDAATKISDDDDRVRALAELAPFLPPGQQPAAISRAFDTAIASSDHDALHWALTELGPRQPPEQLERALEAVARISDDHARGSALTALAPRLRPGQLTRALDVATAIDTDHARFLALYGLATHLPPDQAEAALDRALEAASAIKEDFAHDQALAELAQAAARHRALEIAAAIRWEGTRAKALAELAPNLPSDQLTDALEIVAALSWDLTTPLIALAPLLPPDQLHRALGIATAIRNDFYRAEALSVLAPSLPPDQGSVVLAQALDAATIVPHESARARALSWVGHLLSPSQLARALDVTSTISDDEARASALAGLARNLPPDLLTRALDAAAAIHDDQARAKALAELGPYLDPGQLSFAFTAASTIGEEIARASALAALASDLPADQLIPAFNAIAAINDDGIRAQALAALAPLLPPDQQSAALTQALDAAAATKHDEIRALVLTKLAPDLPPSLVARALGIATAISADHHRNTALAALAPRLSPEELIRASGSVSQSGWISSGSGRDRQNIETILAILARSKSFPAANIQVFLYLFRDSLKGKERASCLSIITNTASSIKEAGGIQGITECADSIVRTAQWWQ